MQINMENQDPKPFEQSKPFEQQKPPVVSGLTYSPKKIIIGVGILSAFVIGIGLYVLGLGRSESLNQSAKQPNTSSQVNPTSYPKTNWKPYINDFYHFTLSMPADWTTNEFVNENGEHIFKLSSADKQMAIQNERVYDGGYGRIEKDILRQQIEVGRYQATRDRFLSESGRIGDIIYLPSDNQQKELTIHLIVNGNFESNNQTILEVLKTFAYTQEEPLLEELFSYTLPGGWAKDDEQYKPIEQVAFHSLDIKYPEGSSYFLTGAKIGVSRYSKNPKSTLKKDIDKILVNYENKTYDYLELTIADYEALNAFICWEGCSDSYFFVKDNHVWRIDFTCAPNCFTKAETNTNPHARERDLFIRSIKFN